MEQTLTRQGMKPARGFQPLVLGYCELEALDIYCIAGEGIRIFVDQCILDKVHSSCTVSLQTQTHEIA